MTKRSPQIAILLTTYNGEQFLSEQLDSFAGQTHENWTVYASDDGSADGTLAILRRYQQQWGESRLHILKGPCKGFAANFMSLISNPAIEADYFAFSDQDDIWFPDKLERSLAVLDSLEQEEPALYCSRTRLVDIERRVIGHSPLFCKAPSFRNALVQSLAGANTMVLNRAARDLMATVPTNACVVSHDWLAYLLVTGCGGSVVYDPQPTLDYRQHDKNLVGANSGFKERVARIARMWRGTFSDWNDQNLQTLRSIYSRLKPANRRSLDAFDRARKSHLLGRLYLLKNAGVYRQTFFGSAGLILAASLKRI